MTYIDIINAENIVEGIIASIFIVLNYAILKKYFKFSKAHSTIGGWFITWILRKFSVNFYKYLNRKYGYTIPPLRLDI